MDPVTLAALVAVGIGPGILGALFGLGGGVIFVPVLLLVFGFSPSEAAAVSLVGIVAGSVGSSSVYTEKGQSNVRLGLLLEITTAAGAIIGAFAASLTEDWILMVVFSAVLILSGYRMATNPERIVPPAENSKGRFSFEYRDEASGETVPYEVRNVGGGMALCTVAGMVSSMTGVGGGAIKVPLMNIYMRVPIKAAAATSAYMIGITAFSGALAYFLAGQISVEYAAPIAVGSFAGAVAGAAVSKRINARHMRKYFSVVLFAVAGLVLLRVAGVYRRT